MVRIADIDVVSTVAKHIIVTGLLDIVSEDVNQDGRESCVTRVNMF